MSELKIKNQKFYKFLQIKIIYFFQYYIIKIKIFKKK